MSLETILKKAGELSEGIVAEESVKVDKDAMWPEKSLRAVQKAGLTGLAIPVQYGGLGEGMHGLIRVCEILAKSCPSTAMCFGMHIVGSAVIRAKATESQVKEYLEPIAAGNHLTTLALSEPGTGAHIYYPQTKLEYGNKGFIIDGEKTFVTNGAKADSYVVSTMALDKEAVGNQFSCVVVDDSTQGLTWGSEWNGLGMRGNSSRGLKLNKVSIPQNKLLGEEGDQLWYMFNVIAPYFLMAMTGTYLGVAQAAFDEAKNHLTKRTYSHSGASLNQVSILQHRLGTLWAKVERTRTLAYHASQQADKDGLKSLPGILAAKAEIAHCAVDLVNEAMTLCGGVAYRSGSKLHQLLRDARAAHIMAPTTDILYTWLGRAILEQPILAD